MKKRIIICGYPKSGNTWLTRLTAEIVGCPVVGFWCEPFTREMATEGLERESDYQCFKAHHSIFQMNHTFVGYADGNEKLIYVIRDPRDVIVSASYYFNFRIPRVKRLFHAQKYKLDTLTKGLVKGTHEGCWLRVPWKEHVMGYLNSGALIVKYETLKANPLSEAKRICEYLNIEKNENHLIASIENQSFEKKKKLFGDSNQPEKANFLRKGISGKWKEVLSSKNIKMINNEIGEFLEKLEYK